MAFGEKAEDAFAVQFGLLNISNQERVIPIGLLSFAQGGRLSLEVSFDSLGYNRLTLLSGSRYLYTILDLDSQSLNPGKRDTYHRENRLIRTAALGLAVPVNPNFNARLERIAYSRRGSSGINPVYA